jgi:hypothetical protein
VAVSAMPELAGAGMPTFARRACARPGLSAHGYRAHPLHAPGMLWVEKNCYVDVVIELVHAMGGDPLAMGGYCLATDFEGDHWTFFKPPHEELRLLYGLDVQELNVWRPLLDHACEQLAAGRFISTEADAHWLPDTAGTDYRRGHQKTTIILADVDVAARRLGYFHNAAYHELDGEDFAQLFHLDQPADSARLPLYAELIRTDRFVALPAPALAAVAWARLAVHASRRPRGNPVAAWGTRFATELPMLQAAGLSHYHAWAFATTRQVGASAELLAAHLRWLAEADGADGAGCAALEVAAASFLQLSGGAARFVLKGARAVSTGRPLEAGPLFGELAAAWDAGVAAVDAALAAHHASPQLSTSHG